MKLYGMIAGFVLIFAADADAALDLETKVPYRLRIVLRVADHPDFTEDFRQELKRDLRTSLQAALGPLATVEIVDLRIVAKEKWEPLWKLVDEKGLEALDSYREVGGGKTHFLRIDFRDGHYDLQSRQHDGTSGFVTPTIRRASTHARGFVSRQAGLMIGHDFGLVATLDPTGANVQVFLRAKAGDLGPLDKWVKKGEVFAVVQIKRERRRIPANPLKKGPARTIAAEIGERVDGTLLLVEGEPRGGIVPCKIFSRYDKALPSGGLGFRCVKLGTTEGPLKLRLVDAAGIPLKGAALQVHARADDFPTGAKEIEQALGEDGVYVTRTNFANVAFVRVALGNNRLARIPVELSDDGPQVRTVRLDPKAEARDRLDGELRGILSRITDGRLIQVRLFQEIAALEQANKKQQARDRGGEVMKAIDALMSEVQKEITDLQERVPKELPGFLGDCERQLLLLHNKQDELKKHLGDLQVAIAEENDPNVLAKKKKVQDLVRNAELFVAQAEYEKAIAKYEEAIAAVQDETEVKERIEAVYRNLKKSWAVKEGDAAHAEARNFIAEVWPKLGTLSDVTDRLAEARKAFEKCKSVGDRLGVNKMQLTGVEVATRFGDELKKRIDSATEEDRKALEMYQKVNEDFQKLLREIEQFLVR